jgi:hypothetical protein
LSYPVLYNIPALKNSQKKMSLGCHIAVRCILRLWKPTNQGFLIIIAPFISGWYAQVNSYLPSRWPKVYIHCEPGRRSPELNIPVALPVDITEWTPGSSFIQVIPVPGRAVSSWGTKVLFLIEIVVTTFPDGEVVLVETGTMVVTTGVGSVIVARVNSAVGIVVGRVIDGVVTASGTGVWVHPMQQTNAIKRITKPIYFFMSS